MPYILPELRKKLLSGPMKPCNVGELNYVITHAVHCFLADQGPMSYSAINEAIGVLECAKLELYRMVAAPYEDGKRQENGRITDLDTWPSDFDTRGRSLPPIYKIDGEKVTKEEYDAFLQERERTSDSKDYVKPRNPPSQAEIDEMPVCDAEPCPHAPGGG